MLEYIDFLRGNTQAIVQTTDDFIKVSPKMVEKLNSMKEGNHIYLTLTYLDRNEVVKFIKDGPIKQGKIPVQRDVLGKGRKNFPCTTCISAEMVSIQLKEFICQSVGECQ